ncbi:hypothetical protein GQ457_09G026040 [Hibiscus cannabinus]
MILCSIINYEYPRFNRCGCWDSSPGLHGHNVEFSPLNYNHNLTSEQKKFKEFLMRTGFRGEDPQAKKWFVFVLHQKVAFSHIWHTYQHCKCKNKL